MPLNYKNRSLGQQSVILYHHIVNRHAGFGYIGSRIGWVSMKKVYKIDVNVYNSTVQTHQ